MTSQKIPSCIGIILDGNRRWARGKNLPTFEGHARGLDNLEAITRAAQGAGLAHLVVYAFSTENWQRSQEEVSYLMELILTFAREHMERLLKEGVRVRFVGQRERLSPRVRAAVEEIEEKSANGDFTLWVCLSYGGRAEIAAAARALQARGEEISEESFARHLWTAEMPDPDLIIRTGGEQRLSNFLLWQAAYSELFFTSTLWPDFSPDELRRILGEYGERERRMGR